MRSGRRVAIIRHLVSSRSERKHTGANHPNTDRDGGEVSLSPFQAVEKKKKTSLVETLARKTGQTVATSPESGQALQGPRTQMTL